MKNITLTLIAVICMIAGVNAQARYKHMPRVKVDRNYEKTEVKKELPSATTTSYANNEVNTNSEAASETPVVTTTENTTVASSNKEEVVVENHKTKNVVKSNKKVTTTKGKKKIDLKASFNDVIKKSSKLFNVKNVKKENLAKWVIFVIIFGALALLFLILLIVGYAIFSYIMVLIGWIFFWLCLAAAGVFLTLGLLGVMS